MVSSFFEILNNIEIKREYSCYFKFCSQNRDVEDTKILLVENSWYIQVEINIAILSWIIKYRKHAVNSYWYPRLKLSKF